MLVTGGAGYLGRAVVDAGVHRGLDVVATWHRTAPPALEARWEQLDVRDPDALARLVRDMRADLVVHTAYVPSGPDLWAVSAALPGRLAEVAAGDGARLVHLSTDVVFDGEKDGPYTEDDESNPVTDYGRAKAESERLVLAADPAALVVRTSLLYGGDEPGPQERLVADALDGGDVTFFTDELRCPVRVGDLAEALLDLAPLDVAGPLHVAGAETVSRAEFARRLAVAAGRDPAVLRTGPGPRTGRPPNCALDCTRAFALLGRNLAGP